MTPKVTETEAQADTKALPPKSKPASALRITRAIALVFLLIAACAILRLRKPDLPPVVLLPPSTAIRHNPVPDRWIPRSWGWMWRARDFIFRRTPVNFNAQIVRFTEPSLPAYLEQLPSPALVTNDLRIWNLSAADFQNATVLMKGNNRDMLATSRIMTADGIVAAAFSGINVRIPGGFADVGFKFEVLPQTHRRKTDVTLNVKWTELLDRVASTDLAGTSQLVFQTNLWQTARAQIPIGNGVVLMQSPDKTHAGVVVLLSIDRK